MAQGVAACSTTGMSMYSFAPTTFCRFTVRFRSPISARDSISVRSIGFSER